MIGGGADGGRTALAPPGSGSPPRAPARRGALGAMALVLLAALAVRVGPYQRIFTRDGVLLGADGDTYYHALRAERLALDWPHVPWRDPGMNHPLGADVPWPPLLDLAVASVAIATGGAAAEHVAATAAVLPPVFGLAVVALVAALGAALLGGGPRWDAALLVALLPAAARVSFVGRADHHVLEVLIGSGCLMAWALALRGGPAGRRCQVLLGGLFALAFWNWSGSALYLALLAAHTALLHLASRAGDEVPARAAGALARAGVTAAATLGATVAAFGPPGALLDLRLTPVTGLSAVLCAATAAGAGALWAARRWDGAAGAGRRALHLASAALLPVATVMLLPRQLTAGVVHGLAAVGASTPWYATIHEFWPLLLSGRQPWPTEALLALLSFGLTLPLLPVGLWLVVRDARRATDPARRTALGLLACWASALLVMVLARRRFEAYAVVPFALCSAYAVRALVAAVAARFAPPPWTAPAARVAALLAVAAPSFPVALTGAVVELPADAAEKDPLLDWLRGVPAAPGREGVMAAWSHGHEIQWFARKPVVSTPFGTDIDPRSMADQATFYATADPGGAVALLRRRQVGFVLVDNPVREIATMAAFAPGAPAYAVEERDLSTGSRYALREELFDLVVARLYFFDGGSRAGDRPALGGYRLLDESDGSNEVLGLPAQAYKLFGVVEGAILEVRGAAPGATVTASVAVRTRPGRTFTWSTAARADADGKAALRVPWAAGSNGTSAAGPVRVSDGERAAAVSVGEAAVVSGAAIGVDLRG